MPSSDFDLYRPPSLGPANLRLADADEAKSSGGMVALYPREDDAANLAIPGGVPPEELHVTLAYVGEDVTGINPDPLPHAVANVTDSIAVITAYILGPALFNPDGGVDGDKDPCAVYLVSDSEQLPDVYDAMLDAVTGAVPDLPEQHVPWVPHITAGYDLPIEQLTYTGPVMFDRIGLAFAGDTHYFPLVGVTLAPYRA